MKRSTLKTIAKIFAILLIVVTVMGFSTSVFADDALASPDSYKPTAGKQLDGDTNKTITDILGVIRNVAVIAAVAVIMFVGIKYIMGSVEEKAEYKKTFMPLIIGILLVVGATTIAGWLFKIAD